ncbi:PHO85 cyclin-1 [Blastocladiella emersonii ATCC 22665]|nr:PHO85 cyclin-1 [Blastocladiella emersonii ATCC 22665]
MASTELDRAVAIPPPSSSSRTMAHHLHHYAGALTFSPPPSPPSSPLLRPPSPHLASVSPSSPAPPRVSRPSSASSTTTTAATAPLHLAAACNCAPWGSLLDHLTRTASATIDCHPSPTTSSSTARPCTWPLSLPLARFAQRTTARTAVDAATVVGAILLLGRVRAALPSTARGIPTTHHRLLLAALLVAAKLLNDCQVKNTHWAHATGVALVEINLMERQLLALLQFDVALDRDAFEQVLADTQAPYLAASAIPAVPPRRREDMHMTWPRRESLSTSARLASSSPPPPTRGGGGGGGGDSGIVQSMAVSPSSLRRKPHHPPPPVPPRNPHLHHHPSPTSSLSRDLVPPRLAGIFEAEPAAVAEDAGPPDRLVVLAPPVVASVVEHCTASVAVLPSCAFVFDLADDDVESEEGVEYASPATSSSGYGAGDEEEVSLDTPMDQSPDAEHTAAASVDMSPESLASSAGELWSAVMASLQAKSIHHHHPARAAAVEPPSPSISISTPTLSSSTASSSPFPPPPRLDARSSPPPPSLAPLPLERTATRRPKLRHSASFTTDVFRGFVDLPFRRPHWHAAPQADDAGGVDAAAAAMAAAVELVSPSPSCAAAMVVASGDGDAPRRARPAC